MTSGGQQRVDLLAYGVGGDTNKPNCLHHDGVDDPPNAGSFSRIKRKMTPGLQGWTIHDGENWTIPIIPQRDSGNGSKQDRGATPTGTPSQGRSIPNTPRRITSVRNDGEYRPPSLSMHLSPFVTVVQGRLIFCFLYSSLIFHQVAVQPTLKPVFQTLSAPPH